MSKKQKRKSTREPLKYDPPFEIEEQESEPRPKYKLVLAYLLDQDEVNSLIEASSAPYVEPPPSVPPTEYNTYTQEEVSALLDSNYVPRKLKKKNNLK